MSHQRHPRSLLSATSCAIQAGEWPPAVLLLFSGSWPRLLQSRGGRFVSVQGRSGPRSVSPDLLNNRLQGEQFSSLWLLSVSFCKARHSREGRWDRKAGHKG